MKTNRNLDAFESWLATHPEAELPSELRAECLDTIPVRKVARRQQPAALSRSGLTRLIGGTLALSAALIAALWIVLSDNSSVFAQALAESRGAAVIHIVEMFQDPERQPGKVTSNEWWIAPRKGVRRIAKRNGEVAFEMVRDNTTTSVWFPEKNEVRIEPSAQLEGVGQWIVDPTADLLFLEKKAKDQGVPIKTSESEQSGRLVRRVRMDDVVLDKSDDASLIISLVVEIDVATNRVVRRWSHERALGKNRESYSSLDATTEFVIDYPDAGQFGASFFELDYPDDARVTRLDLPYFGSSSGPVSAGAVATAKAEREMFIVAPISTRLQELGNGVDEEDYDRATAAAWVLVNGDALSSESNLELDPRALSNCLQLLKRRLQTLRTAEQRSVRFKVLCRPPASGKLAGIMQHSSSAVKFGLEGVAQSCGFTNSLATIAIEDQPGWDEIVASFSEEGNGRASSREEPLGDDLIQVFPVTTAISRFEYGRADCVVQVLTPLDRITAQLAERTVASMQRYVAELGLSNKHKIAFLMTAPQPGHTFTPQGTVFDRKIWKESLGFDKAIWMMRMPVGPAEE